MLQPPAFPSNPPCEANDITARLPDQDLPHAVECRTLRHDDFQAIDALQEIIEIIDLNERPRSRLQVSGDLRHILLGACTRLKHQFGGAVLEDDEDEPVVARHLDRFLKSEPVQPERKDGLDLFDNQYWCDLHGLILRMMRLRRIGKNGRVPGRGQPAELAKFVDEMGLIVVAVIERKAGPIGRAPRHVMDGRAKSYDAAEHLRANSGLLDPKPPELARAQPRMPGELIHGGVSPTFHDPKGGALYRRFGSGRWERVLQ